MAFNFLIAILSFPTIICASLSPTTTTSTDQPPSPYTPSDGATRSVVARFDALMTSLERMNGTIFTLLSTLEATQRQVDHKLGWLVELLGESAAVEEGRRVGPTLCRSVVVT